VLLSLLPKRMDYTEGRAGFSARRSNGSFGAKGLADGFACFHVRAADQIDAIRHRSKNAVHHSLAIGVFQAFQRLGN